MNKVKNTVNNSTTTIIIIIIIQWNLSDQDTLKERHLYNQDAFQSPNNNIPKQTFL